MIYEVQTPDGRIIEVEGEPGQEDVAIQLVKDYLDKEKTEDKKKQASKVFDDSFFDYDKGLKNNKIRALLGIAEGRDQSGREIEKEGLLTTYAGDEGFTYDSRGNLAITPEGQRTLSEKNLFDEKLFSDKNIVIDEKSKPFSKYIQFCRLNRSLRIDLVQNLENNLVTTGFGEVININSITDGRITSIVVEEGGKDYLELSKPTVIISNYDYYV